MDDDNQDYHPDWMTDRLERARRSRESARPDPALSDDAHDKPDTPAKWWDVEDAQKAERKANAARRLERRMAESVCRTCARHAAPTDADGLKVFEPGRTYPCTASIPAMPPVSVAVTVPPPSVREMGPDEGAQCPRWVLHVPRSTKPEPRPPIVWPGMSQRHWDALSMRDDEGMTQRDIASRLGVSPGRVQQMLVRADRMVTALTTSRKGTARLLLLHAIDLANHLAPEPTPGRRRPRK